MKKIIPIILISISTFVSAQTKIDMKCRYDEYTADGQGKTISLVRKYFENNTPDSIYTLLDKKYLESNSNLKKELNSWTAEVSKHYKLFSFNIGGFECDNECKNHSIILSYWGKGTIMYMIQLYLNHNDPNSKIYKIEFENKFKEYLKKQNEEEELMPPEPQ